MTDCCEGPCDGATLDRLIQPAILTVLAGSDGLHGYELDRRLSDSPMMRGRKPDLAGVYRLLRRMEERGLVAGDWDMSDPGPPKRVYHVTDGGLDCLGRWVRTLGEYCQSLTAFIGEARGVLHAAAEACCCTKDAPSPDAALTGTPKEAPPGVTNA